MFSTIYRPTHIADFIGNKSLISPFTDWLKEWTPKDKKKRCALLSSGGLCGIGKSLFVSLLIDAHNYNLIELEPEEEMDKSTMSSLLETPKTFDGKKNVLLISDICTTGNIVACLNQSTIPIVCICSNRYDQHMKPILPFCVDFKMTKPSYQDVYALMYKVVIKEKIRIKEPELKKLYDQSNGDIRFMLNTLQFGLRQGGKNLQSANIFETTASLLSMDTELEDKYATYWLSNELHTLMVQENYIDNTLNCRNELAKLENLSYSAEALSVADIMDTKVDWELTPYTALNTIQATTKCNKKYMIKFPQYLGKIALINKNRREKNMPTAEPTDTKKKVIKEKVVKEPTDAKKKVIKEKVVKEKVVKEQTDNKVAKKKKRLIILNE